MSYAKLFRSILTSTVWLEEHHVVRVWIFFLAEKDQDGIVEGSIPGIARIAKVTTEECEEAIAKFLAPDSYSRTKDHDGRRIEEVDGGWRVLNHQKYRDKEDLDERREKARNRQQSRRDRAKEKRDKKAARAPSVTRHATSRDVTPGNAESPQITPSDTEAYVPDREPASVLDPDVPASPSGDPDHGGGGDLGTAPAVPTVNRGWARASGAAVPPSPLPGANTRDVATSSRVSDVDPDPRASERKRLIAALAPLHVERYREVRAAIGSTVPLLAYVQAERAIRDHLDLQTDLAGYEERARHVIAVREAEARRGSLRYFGIGLWREPAWGMACTMEIGVADAIPGARKSAAAKSEEIRQRLLREEQQEDEPK